MNNAPGYRATSKTSSRKPYLMPCGGSSLCVWNSLTPV